MDILFYCSEKKVIRSKRLGFEVFVCCNFENKKVNSDKLQNNAFLKNLYKYIKKKTTLLSVGHDAWRQKILDKMLNKGHLLF